jgi:hypothetical protein
MPRRQLATAFARRTAMPSSNGMIGAGGCAERAGLAPSIAQAALDFAYDGWPTFPRHPATKRPLTGHGFQDATADPLLIGEWRRRWPKAMIGIPTRHRASSCSTSTWIFRT